MKGDDPDEKHVERRYGVFCDSTRVQMYSGTAPGVPFVCRILEPHVRVQAGYCNIGRV